MYGYGGMPGGGMGFGMGYGFGWVFMVLIWVLLIVGIVAVVKWLFASSGYRSIGHDMPTPRRGAMQILEERFARGEIDREEFLARKQDLQG